VPNAGEMVIEFRDTDPPSLMRWRAVRHWVDQLGGAYAEMEPMALIAPTPRQGAAIQRSSKALGEDPMHIPSGAGCDSMVVGRCIPAAMLFVPSIGGRSTLTSPRTPERRTSCSAARCWPGCRRQAACQARSDPQTGTVGRTLVKLWQGGQIARRARVRRVGARRTAHVGRRRAHSRLHPPLYPPYKARACQARQSARCSSARRRPERKPGCWSPRAPLAFRA
jgi:hypothetical protein